MTDKKKIEVGDVVDYHMVTGGSITSRNHLVLRLIPRPNYYGCDCAMIAGKCGVVSLDSLTHSEQKTEKV